jgi:hypothetical protein
MHPYSGTHNRQRAEAITAMPAGQPCPHCGAPMFPDPAAAAAYGAPRSLGQLDYDHITPLALGGPPDGPKQLAHAHCNRAAGSRLGNRIRARVPARVPRPNIERW